MPIKIALDEQLVASAVSFGEHSSGSEAVTVALEQYVQRLKQRKVIESFGTIDYDEDYDYKRQRNVR